MRDEEAVLGCEKKNLADDAPDSARRLVQDPNEAGQQVHRYWRAISQAHRSVIQEDHSSPCFATYNLHLTTSRGKFTERSSRDCLSPSGSRPLTLTACRTAHSDALAGLECASSARHTSTLLHVGNLSEGFAASKDVFIPAVERCGCQWTPGPSSRCPAASHAAHLSLQNLHHGYVLWIEEVFARVRSFETVASAHRACSADDCGILFTSFGCAYSSVDRRWICRFLERANIPDGRRNFLRRHACAVGGQFLIARRF